jgi:lipoyl(octanoyl) transferase
MAQGLTVDWLGRVPYGEALLRQEAAVAERRSGASGDRLLLLEHPRVITLGRSARPENLRTPRAELAAKGVELREVARGGDVTYHGPGQLVGYTIVDLQARGMADVHAFLRQIEAALIDALAELGVAGAAVPGRTGVFVAGSRPPRKIASIGLGLRRWITWHGFALNATLDPADFGDIVPCGLHDVEMTAVARERERGGAPAEPAAALFDRTRACVARAFEASLA